jgi:serine/threonine protein kinase
MFCREALVWRQLKHANVQPFLGVDAETFKTSGHICMVSPWVAKGTLLQVIQSGNLEGLERTRLVRIFIILYFMLFISHL